MSTLSSVQPFVDLNDHPSASYKRRDWVAFDEKASVSGRGLPILNQDLLLPHQLASHILITTRQTLVYSPVDEHREP